MRNRVKLDIEGLGGKHFTGQGHAFHLPRALPSLAGVVEHNQLIVVVGRPDAFPAVGFAIFLGDARLDGSQTRCEEVTGGVP